MDPFEGLLRVTGVLSRKMPEEVYLLWTQFQEVNNPPSSVLDPNQEHLSYIFSMSVGLVAAHTKP